MISGASSPRVVWPGRRRVPEIVAPDSWGARGAECLPRDVLRRSSPATSPCDGTTVRRCLCHGTGSGTTEARPPASSVPPAPHGGKGGLSCHPANSGPDFRSSSSIFSGLNELLLLRKSAPGRPLRRAEAPRLSLRRLGWARCGLGVDQLRRVGLRRQAYLVTEPFQALDQIVPEMLGVPLVKVIHSQVLVLNVVFQHVIENHQQAVAYRDERPLLAPACRQSAVLGA